MNIGIIGAGKMGSGLGKFWANNGHNLMFSYSRDMEKLKSVAESIDPSVRVGTPAEAVQFADVVLLSVPWAAVPDALKAAGSLDGKILFSCVNALTPDMSGMAVGTTTSGAEEIAKLAPGARLVEALPVFAEVLYSPSRKFGEQEATVFYCGDDAQAKQVVAGLLREIEVEPVDAGPLKNARFVEPAMMLLVQLAYGQNMGGEIGFRLLRR
ncbi:NADPH-dependent F420 reductase [Scytonema tolypothrichoides VB-61278]|nr:NADPH-dependent F420 reductase [Scytonema tolypothrichoides VB-61278]